MLALGRSSRIRNDLTLGCEFDVPINHVGVRVPQWVIEVAVPEVE